MTKTIYLKRGTNEKVTVTTTYKGSVGKTIYYRNASNKSGQMGSVKFKKLHTWLSGERI
jgi:hypothetical protein